MTELIYCAAKNREYAALHIEHGYGYGARLPELVYFPPMFMDQEYKNPDRAAYMAALATYRPRLATVLDWERDDQYGEILSWAEEAAQYVSEAVIIIPKVHHGIARLPRYIGGKQVRLGYSVPTKYGATEVFIDEFRGWPVHALGGSPSNQMRLARYVGVESADGNYIHHKIHHGQFFDGKRWRQLRDAGYDVSGPDVARTVIRLSLPNIQQAWSALR